MSDNSKTAFVAGSTGYVGQAVVAELRSRDIQCIAHIRPQSSRLERLGPHFESLGAQVESTPWEILALQKTLQRGQVSHVFCLIGTTRKQAGAEGVQGNIYEQVDLRLTEALVGAAKNSEIQPRFIYLSSIGAKADAKSKYLQARGKAEATLKLSGLSYVIARPSFITGSGRDEFRPLERMSASLSDGVLGLASLFGAKKLKRKYESSSAGLLARRLVEKSLSGEQGIFEGASLGPAQK